MTRSPIPPPANRSPRTLPAPAFSHGQYNSYRSGRPINARHSSLMPRKSLMTSLFAFAMLLGLAGGMALPVSAQGDETTLDEGTPPPDQGSEPEYGLLQLSAVTCTGGDAGMVSILLASEYAPPGECVDGFSALLIDGSDYGAVAPYLEVQLTAGVHSLYDPATGAARDIEVVAGTATSVIIVTFAAAEPTAEPAVVPAAEAVTTGLLVVAHSCKPAVQSVDQLYALGNLTARLNACPAFTLPGYPSPGGTVNGGELSYDFSLTPATGDVQTLTGNGAFVSDAFCESMVGELDADPTNDRCVSNSGFSFQLPEGAITFTQSYYPDTMRYVAAETGSDADAGVITGSDPSSGYLGLDTSLRGTDQPVIHLFYLNPPRVNVVVHVCGPDISSSEALQGLGSLAAQLLTCPATARYAEGGSADFGVTVADAYWGARGLDSSIFDPTYICESDIGDWNGDGSDNACVEAPTYRFDQTAQGYVTVSQDYAPDGYTFGGASSDSGTITSVDPAGVVALDTTYNGDVTVHLFDIVAAPAATATPLPTATKTPVPPSATATRTAVPPSATVTRTRVPATATATRTSVPPTATATRTSVPATATTTLTSIPGTATTTPVISTPVSTATQTATIPLPTATGTTTLPTATATESTGSTTGSGTVIVAALYCLSGSGTTIVALPPGQQASASDMGGSGCFSGDATIELTLADGTALSGLKLGRDGVESIQNVPATSSGSHTIREGLTGQSASVDVADGTVTRVVIRYGAGTSMLDEGVSSPGGTSSTTGGSGGSTGGLVTDDLIGDEGVSSSAASYDGISFTSLVIDDVDAQAVSSVKTAQSLPGVGVFPMSAVHEYLALIGAFGLLLAGAGFAARRSGRRAS